LKVASLNSLSDLLQQLGSKLHHISMTPRLLSTATTFL
jgi:hypothetical protein